MSQQIEMKFCGKLMEQVTAVARKLGFSGDALNKSERQASEWEKACIVEVLENIPQEYFSRSGPLIEKFVRNIVLSGTRAQVINPA